MAAYKTLYWLKTGERDTGCLSTAADEHNTLMILSPVWTPARIAAPSGKRTKTEKVMKYNIMDRLIKERQKQNRLWGKYTYSAAQYVGHNKYIQRPSKSKRRVTIWMVFSKTITVVILREGPVSQLHPKQRDLDMRQVIMRFTSDSIVSSLQVKYFVNQRRFYWLSTYHVHLGFSVFLKTGNLQDVWFCYQLI